MKKSEKLFWEYTENQDKIKLNLEGLPDKIKEFLQYFQNQFLDHYLLQYWSYYKQYSLRTNNSCESYNKVINSYFVKKPIFWKLLYILRQEMSTVEKNYNDSIDFENPFIKKMINYILVKLNNV